MPVHSTNQAREGKWPHIELKTQCQCYRIALPMRYHVLTHVKHGLKNAVAGAIWPLMYIYTDTLLLNAQIVRVYKIFKTIEVSEESSFEISNKMSPGNGRLIMIAHVLHHVR